MSSLEIYTLLVLLVFRLPRCGGAIAGANVLNMNAVSTSVFLGNGLANILVTANLGQLTAQVNSTKCMLDLINTR
jgi:hypothetical protein